MKKLVFIIIIGLMSNLAIGQVPQGFNYQAIALNGSIPITTNLPVRITIQSESTGGIVFWQELHSSVTPNESGMFSLVVGTGEKQPSSTLATFSDIDWTVTPKYIKTEIDYGGWKTMGAAELLTVPYSMVAGVVNDTLKSLYVKGQTTSVDDALFEVKNNTGQTVFAVYNEGVRIYVDDGDKKGLKGGFAIGGFGSVKGGNEYLRVTKDSTRVYINDLPDQTNKGGFAIGGFGSDIENYSFLKVDEDKLKGGKVDYLNLTSLNTFIGEQAGINTVPSGDNGVYNSFIGFEAGKANTSGSKNVFMGYRSGMSNIDGFFNVIIGDSAGISNSSGDKNVFLGNYAGTNNIWGSDNIYIGYKAGYLGNGSQNIAIGNYSGYSNTTGQNLFIGEYAGEKNSIGTRNSFVGFFAGRLNETGQQNSYFGQFAGDDNTKSYNTFIGYWAGGDNVDGEKNAFLGYRSGQASNGSNNVFLGYKAGEGNTGSDNVLIGYEAGSYSGAKSNVLYIDNSSTSTPLIGGDFATDRVGINRIPTANTLEVGGTIWASGAITASGGNSTNWNTAFGWGDHSTAGYANVPTNTNVQNNFQFVTYKPGSFTPVAFGFISSNGSVLSGSGNFTCAWNTLNSRYEITITGENYYYSSYTTIVQVASSTQTIMTGTSSSSNKLLVYLMKQTF